MTFALFPYHFRDNAAETEIIQKRSIKYKNFDRNKIETQLIQVKKQIFKTIINIYNFYIFNNFYRSWNP